MSLRGPEGSTNNIETRIGDACRHRNLSITQRIMREGDQNGGQREKIPSNAARYTHYDEFRQIYVHSS